MTELLVGTKKGLVVLRGGRGGPLEMAARAFPGEVVEFATRDPRSGRYFAAVTHGQFGPHLYFTDDPTGKWEQAEGPAFPAAAKAAVERIWVIEPGVGDGVVWCGVAPAALFRSDDGGKSWALVEGLWNVPERPKWEPGAGGLCLHSICPWPGDPEPAGDRHLLGRGLAHGRRRKKLAAQRRRPGAALYPGGGAQGHARLLRPQHAARAAPAETLYMQFHGGVYRSDDAGETLARHRHRSGPSLRLRLPPRHRSQRSRSRLRRAAGGRSRSGDPRRQGARVRDARPGRQLARPRAGPAAVAGLPHRAAPGLLQRRGKPARPLFRRARRARCSARRTGAGPGRRSPPTFHP